VPLLLVSKKPVDTVTEIISYQEVPLMTPLPFNLQPAPSIRPRFAQVDLGDYDPARKGWIAVLSVDVPLSNQEHLLKLADGTLSAEARYLAMYDYLQGFVVAWNFTKTTIDAEGNEVTTLIPQPSEGGVRELTEPLMRNLMDAYRDATAASKNS
jgi:hypothetical protein